MDFNLLSEFLHDLYHQYQPCKRGVVASYIPELAKANPNWFGISAVSIDGQQCHVGHTAQCFTIQFMSKPFVYGLALDNWGEEQILNRIGVELTGDPFNSLLEPEEIFRRQYWSLARIWLSWPRRPWMNEITVFEAKVCEELSRHF